MSLYFATPASSSVQSALQRQLGQASVYYISFIIKPIRATLFSVALVFFSILFLIPQQYVSDEVFNWSDKAQHVLAFAILTISGFWSHPKHASAIFLSLLVYGALIEILQALSGWRHGDIMDWAADSIGVLICYGLRQFGLQFFSGRENHKQ